MGLQKHTPEDKDRMVARIDHLRFKEGKTLPDACEMVGREMKKSGKSVKALYNYWVAAKAKKPYLTKKREPTPSRVQDIAKTIQAAVNAHAKPERPINGGYKFSTAPSARATYEHLLMLVRKERELTEKLLDAQEEQDQGSDSEA